MFTWSKLLESIDCNLTDAMSICISNLADKAMEMGGTRYGDELVSSSFNRRRHINSSKVTPRQHTICQLVLIIVTLM